MEIIRAYSRRSLWWIIFFMGLLSLVINSAFYFAMTVVSEKILLLFVAQNKVNFPQLNEFIRQANLVTDMLKVFFVPVSTGVLFLFGFMLWLFSRRSFVKLMEKSYLISANMKAKVKPSESLKKPSAAPVPPAAAAKERKENDNRMFLHLLSVLQKEGRLLDFFSEDLEQYEDDQIGGAVRSIHENCKKAMSKYMASKPVLEENEGDEIVIQPGFDSNAVKLTGNVTGEPPFKGIVRHKGWKTARLELPALSGDRDPNIIAPAEVEIV
ncbi:MAG: hypothetical protein BWK80_46645 [Desulfobacteraceae bacterium IS3]|nr:MAG: hypothetical protein BWK80_46645 [Desulfobacteraceae bacterium IS3]